MIINYHETLGTSREGVQGLGLSIRYERVDMPIKLYVCILKVPCGNNGVPQQAHKAQVTRIQKLVVCGYWQGLADITKPYFRI